MSSIEEMKRHALDLSYKIGRVTMGPVCIDERIARNGENRRRRTRKDAWIALATSAALAIAGCSAATPQATPTAAQLAPNASPSPATASAPHISSADILSQQAPEVRNA